MHTPRPAAGTVSSLEDYGAFVNLVVGGVEVQGLVHISELSWDKVMNPDQVVRVGQEVRVRGR